MNILSGTIQREENRYRSLLLKRDFKFTPSSINRLGLWQELKGHRGCINCIEWDQTGRILYSGSDDQRVIVWNVSDASINQSILTYHTGNIFSVKVAPQTDCRKILSGAADGKICVNDVSYPNSVATLYGPSNRIKQLAVAEESPFSVWSGSEDGTVWEHDYRERESGRILINLTYYPLWYASSHNPIKSIAINPVRNELLAVGSVGPYVRVFDRRMLKPSATWIFPHIREYVPLESETVFCPGHLSFTPPSSRSAVNICVSRIAYGGDGRDLLVNIGGDHIYLFDLYSERCSARYCLAKTINEVPKDYFESRDRADTFKKSKLSNEHPNEHVKRHRYSSRRISSSLSTSKSNSSDRIFERLICRANQHFNIAQYSEAITEYNQALSLFPNSSIALSNRAAAYIKRSWKGDIYQALRDCQQALQINAECYTSRGKVSPFSDVKAFFRTIKCLYELKWIDEARLSIDTFRANFPSLARSQMCESLHCDILAKVNELITNIVPPAFDIEPIQCIDYAKRFIGHCNTTTDIKDVTFLDDNGKYLAAGSDDGCLFIWERDTTNPIKILKADSSILNCVQANPVNDVIATSGIDSVVRLWHPNDCIGREINDHVAACTENQRRMAISPVDLMFINMSFDPDDADNFLEDEELNLVNSRMFQCHQIVEFLSKVKRRDFNNLISPGAYENDHLTIFTCTD
ncbi:hypothetical protein GJ496_007039 [Pomphorhynchus laevis]|nr:hypothetical protein GJ496_005433 [Pomphorhynchus laevis]KAI0984034.1 hypothetical protein GJ496_007039 [Pomphorhynchus laevis]